MAKKGRREPTVEERHQRLAEAVLEAAMRLHPTAVHVPQVLPRSMTMRRFNAVAWGSFDKACRELRAFYDEGEG